MVLRVFGRVAGLFHNRSLAPAVCRERNFSSTANVNLTSIMIGERVADWLRDEP
jgi:hypothetical protein